MKKIFTFNFKQGLVTGVLFAIGGFILGIPPELIKLPTSLPALYILRIFMHDWDIGHGGYILVMVINPVLYGFIGFLIGSLSKTPRHTIYAAGLFVFIILLASFSWFSFIRYERYIRRMKSINELKQQAIKSLESDPNDVYSLHWMGVHHLTRTTKYKEAERYFRKIVDLESTKEDVSIERQRSFIYLAIIYQSWGEHEKAEDYYQQFIASNPNFKSDSVLLHYNRIYLKNKTN